MAKVTPSPSARARLRVARAWSERSFTGPPVAVPSGKIETINPVYSANFPATVAQEYQAVGVTAPVVESAALPSERRTFWFDKIAGIGQLHAYNLEGRILIEYLGALKTDGGGVHEFLGADIVDVVRVPEPITTTVVLGEQLTPRDEDNQLLPLDLSSEWIPSPVQSASSESQSYYGTVTRKDSKRVYYAERENLNAERVAFYWLEQNDAAIHFLTSPAKPELGILWPKIKSHYLQVWPMKIICLLVSRLWLLQWRISASIKQVQHLKRHCSLSGALLFFLKLLS